MKFFRYLTYCSVFTYCVCVDAAPKEKLSNLTCPYILPSEKDFPTDWKILGKIPTEKIQLRGIGLIDGNASTVTDKNFTEEMIEEWEDFSDRSQAVWEYDKDHEDVMLKCIYARSIKESNDDKLNVALLIPLPSGSAVSCLFVRRNISPEFEASCKVK